MVAIADSRDQMESEKGSSSGQRAGSAATAQDRLGLRVCPLVFACSGCSFAGQLADHVARELDRQQLAEMSCLAGVGARHDSFLRRLPRRRVWIVDGCPIECGRGVFDEAGQAGRVTRHIRLHDWGFKKNQSPADGVDVPALARRIALAIV